MSAANPPSPSGEGESPPGRAKRAPEDRLRDRGGVLPSPARLPPTPDFVSTLPSRGREGDHNPARPAAGTRLCNLSDLADPGSRGFMFRDGDQLFLGFIVRRGETVTGFIDHCPHAGMPLAMFPDRYLTREGDLILCTSHGALFRPQDGVCVGGPCAGKALTTWAVRVDAGVVSAE